MGDWDAFGSFEAAPAAAAAAVAVPAVAVGSWAAFAAAPPPVATLPAVRSGMCGKRRGACGSASCPLCWVYGCACACGYGYVGC
jgi:hypothetical protein